MGLIFALLGIGAGAFLLISRSQKSTDDFLREMGINPAFRQIALDAHQEAGRLAMVAPTGQFTAPQIEAASQAQQLAANRTADYAQAFDRFVKSGRTHPNLETIRNDVATMNQLVEWGGSGIDAIRKGQLSQPPRAPAKQPSKSPRAR